ncbi:MULTISPECIES: type II secretion system protein [unclassified Sedimentibacter]|uniref:type II secretion system protein n=1 Tax=unclassified Sedimentibacter TaxID=2649220 RepID=UPI0027DFD8AE|nr:type II secretion system protein [Sedimentibacter sp. MB35-C1]WMJ76670.1 type II secretion system protein [Sedimentibacter sp. MB35-C1]
MKRKLSTKGLTLIEIIITLAILGAVVTPLMSMFITSQRINRESETKYKAIQLAQKYMEDIKSENILDLTFSGYSGEDGNYSKTISDDDGYRLEINLKENDVVELDGDITAVKIPGDEDYDLIVNIDSGTETEINTIKNDESIKVILSVDNGKIKVSNSYSGVKLYLFKAEDSFRYTISGSATLIEVQEDMEMPDNILYYITIKVFDGSRLIETVKGSKVFNSIITD